MKQGFKGNVAAMAGDNDHFRKVLYTGKHLQIVSMTLQPGEDIGEEVHEGHDQFFHITAGTTKVMIDETEHVVAAGEVAIVPGGAKHNVINTSETDVVKLYTMYAPPEHADGTAHATKAEGEADDEHFDGTTTE